MSTIFGCSSCYKASLQPKQSYYIEISAETGLIIREVIEINDFTVIYCCDKKLVDFYRWERRLDGYLDNIRFLRQEDIYVFDHLLINKCINKLKKI